MKAMTFVLLAAVAFAADPEFTADGKLVKPQNYREWVYLSSGLGMTYSEPGGWPDKTMFVLEVRRSASKGSINQGGRFQSEIAAVEASVKDVKRFDDEWGYFGFNGSAKTAPKFAASAGCDACHLKNAAVEHTFVQFYPTLLEIARAKGTLNPGYKAAEK